MRTTLLLFSLLLTACGSGAEAMPDIAPEEAAEGNFVVDSAKSAITFVGKNILRSHEGRFRNFTVDITRDAVQPTNLSLATIETTIDIGSIETDSQGLTTHLLSEDFFEAETYPQASFTSSAIAHREGSQYTITGDLTIKGITQEISFDADFTESTLSFSHPLDRLAFDIGEYTSGPKKIESEIPLSVAISFR